MRIEPRRIRWVKSVTLDEDTLAYSCDDPTVLAREPEAPGDLFELHATDDDFDTLQDPPVGDIIVLTQHDQATHLVEVVSEPVEPRPKRTIRKKTRDERFVWQRTCRLLILKEFEDAPFIREAFGFDPQAKGGDVLEIARLPAFDRAKTPLWMVQRRIERALKGELPSQNFRWRR